MAKNLRTPRLSSKLRVLIKTSTAEVHQMRPFCWHSLIIIIIIVVKVIVGLSNLKNHDFRRSKITQDRRTDGQTDRQTDAGELYTLSHYG